MGIRRALSLIELLVVIAILGIGAAFTAPNINDWMSKYRLKTDANNLYNYLNDTRIKAIQGSRTISFTSVTLQSELELKNLTIFSVPSISFYSNSSATTSSIILRSSSGGFDEYRFNIFGSTGFIEQQIKKNGTNQWKDID